jgi:hypothetical protein
MANPVTGNFTAPKLVEIPAHYGRLVAEEVLRVFITAQRHRHCKLRIREHQSYYREWGKGIAAYSQNFDYYHKVYLDRRHSGTQIDTPVV